VRCRLFARAQAVTIRERDSMEQVPIAGLVDALRERLERS